MFAKTKEIKWREGFPGRPPKDAVFKLSPIEQEITRKTKKAIYDRYFYMKNKIRKSINKHF